MLSRHVERNRSFLEGSTLGSDQAFRSRLGKANVTPLVPIRLGAGKQIALKCDEWPWGSG
jgi:hypothetical protein